jgi:2'-5' RNA ligase
MRLFIASFLSLENIAAYQSLIDELVAEAAGTLRSVPPGTQHLTLGFLGEVSEQDLPECLGAMAVVERLRAISISLDPPQILSARRSPRLLKADVAQGAERVSELQRLLRTEILKRLPRLDIQPKPPHVTLARFKKNANRDAGRRVADLLSQHEGASRTVTDRLDRIQLVKSTLTPQGPIYETVEESLLAGHED